MTSSAAAAHAPTLSDDEAVSTLISLLDGRSREEVERSHLAGSRHAPGGQLVQASDEYVGVRNARVVLVDPEQVRAVMTASWLTQMNWPEVYVLEDAELTESGPRRPRIPGSPAWPTVSAIPEGAAVLAHGRRARMAASAAGHGLAGTACFTVSVTLAFR